MAKKKQDIPALRSWESLNTALSIATDQLTCERWLLLELKGKRRRAFLLRIHSRLNRVRAEAEREVLRRKARGR